MDWDLYTKRFLTSYKEELIRAEAEAEEAHWQRVYQEKASPPIESRHRLEADLSLENKYSSPHASSVATPPTQVPLTQENLRLLEKMSKEALPYQLPHTPASSSRTAKSATPSKGPGAAKSSTSYTAYEVDEILANHGILGPEKGAQMLERFPDFAANARQIINQERGSAMKDSSVRKYLRGRERHLTRNEATTMNELMPQLVKETRSIHSLQDALGIIATKDFQEDFLDRNYDLEFVRGCVPIPDTQDDNLLALLLAKSPGVKNPKPDITYGIGIEAFNDDQRKIIRLHADSMMPSPQICFPFLVVEWKGSKGNYLEAVHQVRRAGASLVNALHSAITDPGTENSGEAPDTRSIVFSCAVSPDVARIFVHWRQTGSEGQPTWCMAKLWAGHMDEGEDAAEFRRCIHNILDWGLSIRLDDMKTLLQGHIETLGAGDNSPVKKKRKTLV